MAKSDEEMNVFLIVLPGKVIKGNKLLRRRHLSWDWNAVNKGAMGISQWRVFQAKRNRRKESDTGVCLMWWGGLKKPVWLEQSEQGEEM